MGSWAVSRPAGCALIWRVMPEAPVLRPAAVKQIGLLIADKQAGAFRLMVKTIEAVATLTSAT